MPDNVMIIRTGIGLIVEGLRKSSSQKVSYKLRDQGDGVKEPAWEVESVQRQERRVWAKVLQEPSLICSWVTLDVVTQETMEARSWNEARSQAVLKS